MAPLQVNCVAGWTSCQEIKSRILVLRRQPPATEVRANGKSPLKWTEENSLVTTNPPCYRLIV
jgi:hypothetical protein